MIRRLPTALAIAASLLLAAASAASASTLSFTIGHGVRIHYLHPEAVKIHKASGPRPVISKVSPMTVTIGQKLLIFGKNFRPGVHKDRVIFIKPGGGLVVAKADSATTSQITITVPKRVADILSMKNSALIATRLHVRVLTGLYSKATKLSRSPLVLPGGATPGSGGTGGPACMQPTNADSDGDGLSNWLEIKVLHTDPCNPDTDGDGVPDGYEYQSALDLENTTLTGRDSQNALPCACKEPYPNPLDPSDANVDHDGDGLTMKLEYELNKYVGGPKVGDLQYSDGKQRSQDVPAPTDPRFAYMDYVRFPSLNAGFLTDDERDADNDGLTNWDECCGRMTQGWWDQRFNGTHGYPMESHYQATCGDGTQTCPVNYPGVDPMNPDTNGNGIPDGLDDQDHDGLTNEFEVSRPWDWWVTYVSVGPNGHSGPSSSDYVGNGGLLPAGVGPNPWARVQPFNPCKPVYSKTCAITDPRGATNAYPTGEDWMGPDPETLGPPPAAPWLYDTTHEQTVFPTGPGDSAGPANGEMYPMNLG